MMGQYQPAEATEGEAQMREAIRQLFNSAESENLIVCGSEKGKTGAIMGAIKGFEPSSRMRTIYVDCWQYSTRMAVYSLIARAIGEMVPRRGLARDEVFDRIIEVMEKGNAKALLVLDGIEGLFLQGEDRLLDAICTKRKLFRVVGIAGDAKVLAKHAPRFAALGFRICGADKIADARSCKAGTENLREEERIILDIVRTGPKTSTELYAAFLRRMKRSKRAIRNYLGRLEARELVRVQTVAGISPLLNTKRIELNSRMQAAMPQDL